MGRRIWIISASSSSHRAPARESVPSCVVQCWRDRTCSNRGRTRGHGGAPCSAGRGSERTKAASTPPRSCCTSSPAPLEVGRPAGSSDAGRQGHHLCGEALVSELAAIVRRDRLEAPSRRRAVRGDAAGKGRAEPCGGVLVGGVKLGPGKARVHVDRGVLPADPLGPLKPPDVEAVHAHQRPWVGRVQVSLGLGGPLGLGRGGVARDQGQPRPPMPQSVSRQAPPDPVGGDPEPAPALPGELGEIRLGPRPGWAREKARIRCSTHSGSWLGILGRRRSRGRRASRPQVSMFFAHR